MSWIPAVAEFALAGILAASSSAKLGSFSDWREAVSRYGLGRRNLPFAIVVPIAELGVAAALTIAIEPLAAVLATSLAVVFAVALLVGMRKRLDDCGVFWESGSYARGSCCPRPDRCVFTTRFHRELVAAPNVADAIGPDPGRRRDRTSGDGARVSPHRATAGPVPSGEG
jgi:hypothetical protein